MQLQDTINVKKVDAFLTYENVMYLKLYFRYITMTKQHYRYFYDTIDIFQKLIHYYAFSNINI